MIPRLLVLVTAAPLLLVACIGGGDPEPTPTPTPPPGAAQPELDGFEGALFIPSLEVGAPVALKPWVRGEALPSPDGANDVAMYDFGDEARLGGLPGQGGNIVLSGRSLALAGCGPAEPPCNGVFTALFRVAPGAEIDLLWRGETFRHQVVALCNVPASALRRQRLREHGTGAADAPHGHGQPGSGPGLEPRVDSHREAGASDGGGAVSPGDGDRPSKLIRGRFESV